MANGCILLKDKQLHIAYAVISLISCACNISSMTVYYLEQGFIDTRRAFHLEQQLTVCIFILSPEVTV